MADDVTVSATIEAGMDFFVTKPFTYDVLAELLRPIFASRTHEPGQGLGLRLGEGFGRGLGQGHGLGQGLGFGSGRTPRTIKIELMEVFETIHEDEHDALPYFQDQQQQPTNISTPHSVLLTIPPRMEEHKGMNMNAQEKLYIEAIAMGGGSPRALDETTPPATNKTNQGVPSEHVAVPNDIIGFQPSLSSRSTVVKPCADDILNEANDAALDVPLAGAPSLLPSSFPPSLPPSLPPSSLPPPPSYCSILFTPPNSKPPNPTRFVAYY